MARKLRPLTESHFVVQLEGDPTGTAFTDCSGINASAETSEYSDGVARRIYKCVGMVKQENVKLSTPFDPDVHAPLIAALERMRDTQDRRNITITPVGDGNDPTPRGDGFTLIGCQLVKFECGDTNRGSAKAAMLKLEFCYDYYQVG
jgi:hypothetical protein